MIKKINIKLAGLLIVGCMSLMPNKGIADQHSKSPDIQCFIVVADQKDNKYHKIDLTDHSGAKVVGFMSNEPFLTRKHLLYAQAKAGRSYARSSKGKASLIIPLTAEGQQIMLKTTSENVMYKIAIFINKELVVAPKIVGKYSGPLVIEGGYSDKEVTEIIKTLNGN